MVFVQNVPIYYFHFERKRKRKREKGVFFSCLVDTTKQEKKTLSLFQKGVIKITQSVRCQKMAQITVNTKSPLSRVFNKSQFLKKKKRNMVFYLNVECCVSYILLFIATKTQPVTKKNRCISRKAGRHLPEFVLFQVCETFFEKCNSNLIIVFIYN